MNKRLFIIVMIVVASFFIFTNQCQREEPVLTEPAKPANILATSTWVGGIDGGVFVQIKKSEKTGDYFAEIFYISGDVAYRGFMKIHPEGSTFDYEKKRIIRRMGWRLFIFKK